MRYSKFMQNSCRFRGKLQLIMQGSRLISKFYVFHVDTISSLFILSATSVLRLFSCILSSCNMNAALMEFRAGIKHVSRLIVVWDQAHNEIRANCNYIIFLALHIHFSGILHTPPVQECRCNFSPSPDIDNRSFPRNHLRADARA